MATVASVYSKALFNVAKEQGEVKKVSDDLRQLSETCQQSGEVQKVLFNALFDSGKREQIAETLATELGVTELSKKFFSLIALKNRTGSIHEITKAYEELMNRESGTVRGSVKVAKKLDPKQLQELSKSISARLGKTVELDQTEEEDLIGGFIVEAGGKTFDSSVRTQLTKLQEVCTQ